MAASNPDLSPGPARPGPCAAWGLALGLALTLAACGGGSSSPSATAGSGIIDGAGTGSTTGGSPGGTTGAGGGATTPVTAQASCGLAGFATEALTRLNQRRAAGASCGARGSFPPAAALGWNTRLEQAAVDHTQEQASLDVVTHVSADGRTLADRVDATGYAWSAIGENVAAGQRSVAAVVDGWMASDGHCANILGASYREIGLACVDGAATTRYGRYWTLVLAAPR